MKINNILVVAISLFSVLSCTVSDKANKDVLVPSDWAEYRFNNGAFSIKVPPTVELRGGNDRYTKIQSELGFYTHADNKSAVFQQKGLSFNIPEARTKYARIMLLFYSDAPGTYPSNNEQIGLITEQDVREMIDNELSSGMRAYDIKYGNEVVNGNQCFIVHYTRTGVYGAPPVKCKICIFFNNRYFLKIVYSYRESECNLWAKDFEKCLQTFRWLK